MKKRILLYCVLLVDINRSGDVYRTEALLLDETIVENFALLVGF